ncbi:MAG: phosphatase, partial [Acidobacteria bacterium]|nr:phosphatase [Acidobacteriota bacterium]
VAAGHVSNRREAFDRYLGDGCRAFVPRSGASPEEVVAIIAGAGGISSLAHPGLLGRDELIAPMVRAGLHALEAYHSKHTPETVRRYLALAKRHGLAVSGGSDFHGDESHDAERLGCIGLPDAAFEVLRSRTRLTGARRPS